MGTRDLPDFCVHKIVYLDFCVWTIKHIHASRDCYSLNYHKSVDINVNIIGKVNIENLRLANQREKQGYNWNVSLKREIQLGKGMYIIGT